MLGPTFGGKSQGRFKALAWFHCFFCSFSGCKCPVPGYFFSLTAAPRYFSPDPYHQKKRAIHIHSVYQTSPVWAADCQLYPLFHPRLSILILISYSYFISHASTQAVSLAPFVTCHVQQGIDASALKSCPSIRKLPKR